MSFSNYLNKRLKETGITQAQLAKEIETGKVTINRWLKPFSSNPREASMKKVIEYFGDDYRKLQALFTAEERWGEYFWRNFRSQCRERQQSKNSIPTISAEAVLRYWHSCPYVEFDDVVAIAKYLNCSVERLVTRPCDVGYNNIPAIGQNENTEHDEHHFGLNINFYADYLILTTEMEPLIHYGDQISLRTDLITGELVVTPQKGDVVVIKSETERRYHIRRYDRINEQNVFVASNEMFPPIPESKNITIAGIVAHAHTTL